MGKSEIEDPILHHSTTPILQHSDSLSSSLAAGLYQELSGEKLLGAA
jgi:hypothetical protein